MKEIQLTQGKVALVDDEDFDFLNRWKWYATRIGKTFYAVRSERIGRSNKRVCMHRAILQSQSGIMVDHKNGDGLDNRRSNLRNCSKVENQRNQGIRQDNQSGFKGVCWENGKQKWRADISIYRRRKFLGHYATKEEAAIAYNKAALVWHGDFARLNQIGGNNASVLP